MTSIVNAAVRLYEQPVIVGRSGKAVGTSSLSSLNNLIILSGLLTGRKPLRTLEIGLALGASALICAAFQREAGAEPNGQHLAIDPFQSTVWDDCGMLALEQAGLAEYCNVIQDFSSMALPRLCEGEDRYDLIYVDGSHIFEDVFVDLYFSARLLSQGGVILFDDASDPHVSKVLRFVRRNMAETLREIDVEHYRSDRDFRARIKYRIARSVGRVQLAAFERIDDPTRPWNATFRNF